MRRQYLFAGHGFKVRSNGPDGALKESKGDHLLAVVGAEGIILKKKEKRWELPCS